MSAPDGLTVSVSQLKEYLACGRRYELHRVRGVEPAFTPLPLAFGSAVHAALASHYSAMKVHSEVALLEELLQSFRDAWSVALAVSVPVRVKDDEADPVDTGVRMLTAFHHHAVALGPERVEAVEMPFSGIVLHDPQTGEAVDEVLGGFMDLVVRQGERLVVVEHKSAGRKWSVDQLEHDFQVTAYKIAARRIGLGEVGLRFQVLTKTKVPAVQIEGVSRDGQAEVDFMRVAAGVLRAIGAGAFWPVRVGWQCASCPYSHACAGG